MIERYKDFKIGRLICNFVVCNLLIGTTFLFSQVDTAWVRRYNGPGNYWDWARAIAVDNSGNVYVTGYSEGSGTSSDYATIKYNSNGDTVWVRRYNGPANNRDEVRALAVDDIGNVYVAGSSLGQSTNYDYATIKYNSNGDTLWVRRYSYPGNSQDVVKGLGLDGQGNVYVGGYTWCGGTSYYVLIVKYDSVGNFVWSQAYTSAYGTLVYAIAVDDSGNVYITGNVMHYGSSDLLTIKYNTNGVQQWIQTYNGPGNPYKEGDAIAIDDSGNVYITGESSSGGPDFDYETIKYNSAGVLQWAQIYNYNYDRPRAIAVDNSGNVYVTGYSYLLSGVNYFNTEYTTIKYNTAGVQEWVQRYNGPSDSNDQARAIVLDEQNNVYVTGTSRGLGTGDDFATVKYNTNGVEQWVARYNGPANGSDGAAAITIDNQGNIYVTGQSYDIGANDDYLTIKYVQTQGIEENRLPLSVNRSSIEIFPNPAKTYFTVRWTSTRFGQNANRTELKIFDISGKLVVSTVTSAQEHKKELRVSLEGFKNGIYFIKVNNKMVKEKLVVTK